MKGVQCYELFGGIALKNHTFSFHFHNCLPILVLLYIMVYIMFACLMLFAALFGAVCLYNAFFPIDFSKVFCFHALSWLIIICYYYL